MPFLLRGLENGVESRDAISIPTVFLLIFNAIDQQRAKVLRHCSDADTKKQLLLMGAIALAPETGGGSLGPALASVF
jgi:hypothetical protein